MKTLELHTNIAMWTRCNVKERCTDTIGNKGLNHVCLIFFGMIKWKVGRQERMRVGTGRKGSTGKDIDILRNVRQDCTVHDV